MTQLDRDRTPAEPEIRADVPAGGLFITIGVFGLYFSRSMSLGTATAVGSGFMPLLVSSLLVLFGAVVLVQGVRQSGEVVSITSLRPLVLVTLCVVIFAVTVERLGLVLAVMLTVFVSAFAGERPRLLQSLVVGAALSVACVAIFIWGAKLPLNAWPF